MKSLLALRADVHAVADVVLDDGSTAKGATPLHIAAEKGFIHLLPLLLDAKANVNAQVLGCQRATRTTDCKSVVATMQATGHSLLVRACPEITTNDCKLAW